MCNKICRVVFGNKVIEHFWVNWTIHAVWGYMSASGLLDLVKIVGILSIGHAVLSGKHLIGSSLICSL